MFNLGFIGDDWFRYYIFDENNMYFGVENVVLVKVELICNVKWMVVDCFCSCEVDLVFVINNLLFMVEY